MIDERHTVALISGPSRVADLVKKEKGVKFIRLYGNTDLLTQTFADRLAVKIKILAILGTATIILTCGDLMVYVFHTQSFFELFNFYY